MISDSTLKMIEKTYNVKDDEFNIRHRLRDLPDKAILNVLRELRPQTFWAFLDEIMTRLKNPEIRAHVGGWDSLTQQEIELDEVRRMAESFGKH